MTAPLQAPQPRSRRWHLLPLLPIVLVLLLQLVLAVEGLAAESRAAVWMRVGGTAPLVVTMSNRTGWGIRTITIRAETRDGVRYARYLQEQAWTIVREEQGNWAQLRRGRFTANVSSGGTVLVERQGNGLGPLWTGALLYGVALLPWTVGLLLREPNLISLAWGGLLWAAAAMLPVARYCSDRMGRDDDLWLFLPITLLGGLITMPILAAPGERVLLRRIAIGLTALVAAVGLGLLAIGFSFRCHGFGF